jgi:hypothetical protein
MDDSQRALRRAAAEAFSRSLDQLAVCFDPELEASLAPPPSKAQSKVQSTPPNRSASGVPSVETSLQALEDAATDIEQLMQTQKAT